MAFLKTGLSVLKALFRVPGSSTGEKWNQSPTPNVCAFDKKSERYIIKASISDSFPGCFCLYVLLTVIGR